MIQAQSQEVADGGGTFELDPDDRSVAEALAGLAELGPKSSRASQPTRTGFSLEAGWVGRRTARPVNGHKLRLQWY
jgi:hypothetical protein